MQNISTNYKKYSSKNPLKQKLIENFQRCFFEIAEIKENSKIADFGCGEGFMVKKISEKYPSVKIDGYDENENALKNTVIQPNDSIKFYKQDLLNLSQEVKDKQYDLVIVLEVLEHIQNYEKALQELSQINAKELILSVPNEPYFSISSLLAGQYIKTLGRHPEHINAWNPQTFKELVEKYFEVEKIKTPFPWIIVKIKRKS